MTKVRVFFSEKPKEELNLKYLTLAQLDRLVNSTHDTVGMLTYESMEKYLEAKPSIAKTYNLSRITQILMVIDRDNKTFKKEKEVSDVLSR